MPDIQEQNSDLLAEKIAEKFINEHYDEIVENIDIAKLANKVGILIQNKLAIEILKKELDIGLDKNIMNDVHTKKYLVEDK